MDRFFMKFHVFHGLGFLSTDGQDDAGFGGMDRIFLTRRHKGHEGIWGALLRFLTQRRGDAESAA